MKTAEKKGAVDYLVMFGAPLAFLALAWWGIASLLGPGPAPNAFELLRDGRVKPGMSQGQVIAEVGAPKEVVSRPDGGASLRYQRSTWVPDRKTFVEEDAYVDLDPQGFVTGVAFESRTPAPVAP
jgi:hypothetical protein